MSCTGSSLVRIAARLSAQRKWSAEKGLSRNRFVEAQSYLTQVRGLFRTWRVQKHCPGCGVGLQPLLLCPTCRLEQAAATDQWGNLSQNPTWRYVWDPIDALGMAIAEDALEYREPWDDEALEIAIDEEANDAYEPWDEFEIAGDS